MKAIFSSALFAPIQYFAYLASASEATIELYDSYSRQSYRNRYVINSATGPQALSVPVTKVSGKKILTRDVRLSYDTPWHEIHWKSIEAAYNSSPFYLFYKDGIEELFRKRWTFLKDLNEAALTLAMDYADLDTPISYTEAYYADYSDREDFRDIIHPKKDLSINSSFKPVPYWQPFGTGKSFIPNLSVLDLIFNMGPESPLILRDSIS